MPTDTKSHWENIYTSKAPGDVSWYQPAPTHSLAMIMRAAPARDAHVIDVGSGASTLIGALLDAGYRDITAVDISAAALSQAGTLLGSRAGAVRWIEADVTRLAPPPASVDVWHDRAVYHFLTGMRDR